MDKFKSFGDLIFDYGRKQTGPDDWSSLNLIEKNGPSLSYISSADPGYAFSYYSSNKPIFAKFALPRPLAYKDLVKRIHEQDVQSALDSFSTCISSGNSTVCYRLRDINDDYHWLLDNKVLAKDENREDRVFGIVSPIPLNEPGFFNTLKHALAVNTDRLEVEEDFSALLAASRACTVCVLDIDKFTVINSSYGYSTGDMLLQQTEEFIRGNIEGFSFFEHYQEDKFLLVFEGVSETEVTSRLRRLQQALREFRFHWDNKQHIITLSIGVVPVKGKSPQPQEEISKAILASSFAKESGRNGIHVHTGHNADMNERKEEMLWVEKINTAVDEDRFVLYYQPILPLNNDSDEKHFELLVRLKDESGNIIPPGSFLPAVERYNLAGLLDQWVIQTAFSWLETYRELLAMNFSWGINLSGKSFADTEMLPFVVSQIKEKKIPPGKVYFEITETAAIANIGKAEAFIRELQNLGCKFALDDFGSGLSSFSYLKNLPVDYLKIDGQFVRNIARDKSDFMIVSSIHRIAKSMNIKTIAEFVESRETAEVLRELGIDYGQGFGIARPEPLHTFSRTYRSILDEPQG